MKLLSNVFRRKRAVIFFAAAFMLPLLFVVIVSIDTFLKRQKTTQNLLESNLWFSGRSALNQFEKQFIKIEGKYLNEDYFESLTNGDSLNHSAKPDAFIINQDHYIAYPEIAQDKNSYLLNHSSDWNPNYKKYMDLAEAAELSSRSFSAAIKNYLQSLDFTETDQQKALAIEGLARSYLAGKNFKQAVRYYKLLKNEFCQIENLSGHPYGISAPLQLCAIGSLIKEKVISADSLYASYQKLIDGHWFLSSSSYFFFKTEYESILNNVVEPGDYRYEKKIRFNQFLQTYLIPRFNERSRISRPTILNETKRRYIQTEDSKYLVSYKGMINPDTDNLYYGGICWKLETMIDHLIPVMLASLNEETGLEFGLVNSKTEDILTHEVYQIPEKSLSLEFNEIPLPWTFISIQPEYEKLESEAKIQLIIYGLLVIIIIMLMFFGVFVLLRDINRETETMLLKTEFVHNVSHELKTPLSLIRLYGETLLLKDKLPETNRKEGLQIITKESERLSYMINNILDFSKIEMGRKEFDMKSGNLKEIVMNTLDSYRYHFVKKGFKIVEDFDQDSQIILFDKNAVEGILINLFSNVIKFSFETKSMKVSLKNSSESTCLSIADQGVGIPADELSNIFNRFYRVKSRHDFEARGSGLGLTLVKHVIDAHGWQIDVKSKVNEGSSFSIIIPLNANKEESL
ncbi:MAG: HAMP domain-containing histidine kinase [Bacteroidetes bacterium]|nr:HAMP domain-containing histidine kinase [Bacteroidota bacterium]MBT4399514.1 HAMP domain-containing histidine kinase [Bacteroidota bacterium]MBT7462642.1 HAMP domain-containing histidine kinase [Bacteroidota bacterium]